MPPVCALYQFLKWLWGAIVLALGLGLIVNGVFAWLEIARMPLLPKALSLLRAYALWELIVIAALLLATLWAGWACRKRRLSDYFALCKLAKKLHPRNLEFAEAQPIKAQGLDLGKEGRLCHRPFYPTYIPRRASDYRPGAKASHSIYTEETLRQVLRDGDSFVLLGQPLEGKSRTLYQVVSQMNGYTVVTPSREKGEIPDNAFSLLKGRRIILLLDDLDTYAIQDSRIDMAKFSRKLSTVSESWVVASTCRGGRAFKDAQTHLERFCEGIDLELILLSATPDEKGELATGIGKTWDRAEEAQYPTLGSIVIADYLRIMRRRFQTLPGEQQDTLRALLLLDTTTLRPTRQRLQAILDHIFQRPQLRLDDCLDALADRDFLQKPAGGVIQPEPAYIQNAVEYTEGRSPEDDFRALIGVLTGLEDIDGLLGLATDGLLSRERFKEALEIFRQVLDLKPANPEAWHGRGLAILGLDKHAKAKEALASFEKAIELRPAYSEAWHHKGDVLLEMGRYEEALASFDKAIDLRPTHPETWGDKGDALLRLGRFDEALILFEKAIELRPTHRGAWFNKSAALLALSRYEEALAACEKVIDLNPTLWGAWHHKGAALQELVGHAANNWN